MAAEVSGPASTVRVAAIVVSWNARKDLERCLSQLPAAFGSLDHEVHVVDNGSDDGSVEAVRARFPDCRLHLPEVNLGYAGGAEHALRVIHCEFVVVLNPDVFAEPGSIELMVGHLEQRPDAALAGPEIHDLGGRTVEQDFSLPRPLTPLYRFPGVAAILRAVRRPDRGARPRRVERVNGCCMVFRRSALERLGGLPRPTFLYGEEIAIGAALRRAGLETWYLPAARVVHADGSSVNRLWSSEQKLLVFKAARILTTREILGPSGFFVWNTLFAWRELLYGLLRPIARLLGRPWPAIPLLRVLELHVLGWAAPLSAGARRKLEAFCRRQ